jgi:hypothetical protein
MKHIDAGTIIKDVDGGLSGQSVAYDFRQTMDVAIKPQCC